MAEYEERLVFRSGDHTMLGVIHGEDDPVGPDPVPVPVQPFENPFEGFARLPDYCLKSTLLPKSVSGENSVLFQPFIFM
jgi:hypothetical protein